MVDIESLKPTEKLKVMDLVASAGIDVSDWANFSRGAKYAAANPKYCYEWSFEDHSKKLVVLCLWHENIEILDGVAVQKLNLRDIAASPGIKPAQSKRAIKVDFALQKVDRLNWPFRVIICIGERAVGGTASKATARMLDGEPWHVGNYDSSSGECLLVRGPVVAKYIDQFELHRLPEEAARRKKNDYFCFRTEFASQKLCSASSQRVL